MEGNIRETCLVWGLSRPTPPWFKVYQIMYRQSSINIIDFSQPHTEESQSPASLKEKVVCPHAVGRRLARQFLKLKRRRKGFLKSAVTTCHHSCCIWTQNIESGKNRVEINLSLGPAFQIFFHSFP